MIFHLYMGSVNRVNNNYFRIIQTGVMCFRTLCIFEFESKRMVDLAAVWYADKVSIMRLYQ